MLATGSFDTCRYFIRGSLIRQTLYTITLSTAAICAYYLVFTFDHFHGWLLWASPFSAFSASSVCSGARHWALSRNSLLLVLGLGCRLFIHSSVDYAFPTLVLLVCSEAYWLLTRPTSTQNNMNPSHTADSAESFISFNLCLILLLSAAKITFFFLNCLVAMSFTC